MASSVVNSGVRNSTGIGHAQRRAQGKKVYFPPGNACANMRVGAYPEAIQGVHGLVHERIVTAVPAPSGACCRPLGVWGSQFGHAHKKTVRDMKRPVGRREQILLC